MNNTNNMAPSIPSNSSFTNLPYELQEAIASYVPRSDAASCTRVSQSWKQLFTPIVWQQIAQKMWKGSPTSWSTAFLNSCEAGALNTYGHLVQSVLLHDFPTFMEHAPLNLPCLVAAAISDHGDDALVGDFIRRCTGGLKELVVLEVNTNEGVQFGPCAVEALLEQASTLQVVRIDCPQGFDSKDIQKLLCSAPNLKELHLLGESRVMGCREGYLDANDVVESEWVCSQLEIFGCRIGNIPRPDITHDILSRPAREHVVGGTQEESFALQRKVYAQLGRLTNLRELRLGRPINKTGWDTKGPSYEVLWYFDCLSFSLDSGLDLLNDLKDLEYLGIQDMDVCISGYEERNWIDENWHNYKIAYDDYAKHFDHHHGFHFHWVSSLDDTDSIDSSDSE